MAKVRAALERIRDPSVQTALSEAAYTHMRPVLKEALVNCPYALTDAEADSLENLGITINPSATQTHTHAACKAIENRMLEIVGSHLPKEACTMLFLKRSKLRYMRRAAALKDTFVNKDVEPKDLFRYDSDTIRSKLQGIEHRIAYISDTLHFMSRQELVQLFVDSPNLETLLATVVLPVEALHRRTTLYPTLYSVNYSPKGFEYIPGNHGGGAYFHPYSTLEWLKVRQIHAYDYYALDPQITLTFQMVESLGANHLFIIRRADMKTPAMRTFCRDSLVTLPKVFCPDSMNANRPLEKKRAMQLMLYCKSVKQVTERDIYAKIRQLIPTQELELYEPDEIVHLANYFYFMAHLDSITCFEDLLSNNVWRRLTLPIRTKFRQLVEFFKGKSDFNKLLQALKWETFTYSLEPEDYAEKFSSHRAREFAEMTDTTVGKAAETLRYVARHPEIVQPEDFASQPIPDPLENCSHYIQIDPATPKLEASTSSVSPHVNAPPPADQAPSQPPAARPCTGTPSTRNSDWQVATIEYLMEQAGGTTSDGRTRVIFHKATPAAHTLGTTPTIADWPEILDDIAISLPAQPDVCILEAFHTSRPGPLLPDIPLWAAQQSTVLCFGDLTWSFPCPHEVQTKNGDHFTLEDTHLGPHAPKIENCGLRSMVAHFITMGTTIPQADIPTIRYTTGSDEASSSQSPPPTSTPNPTPASHRTVNNNVAPADQSKSVPWASWVPLLKNHGFDGDQEQLQPDGQLILPIQDVHKLPHAAYPSEVPHALQDTLNNIKRYPVTIKLDKHRASSYASDIKNNRTGRLLLQMDQKWKASFAYKMQHEDHEVVGTVIHGCAGSGKSYSVQKWMRTLKEDQNVITVVTPTVLLRNDWHTKLPILTADTFKTFEKAIVQPCNPVVVFDDYTKLPPGMIEAMVMHHRNISFIILTGDSRQSTYHELNDEAYISALPEAVEVFAPYCEFYLNATHRNVRDLANKLGVYSERPGKCKINFTSCHLKASKIPILVPSTFKKNAMAEMGHNSMTYAGCQGLTAAKVQIVLDNHTSQCSERVIYTCLSRAVDGIHFINTGPTSGDYWEKLGSTPYLKAFIDSYRDERTEVYNSQPADDSPTEPDAPLTHFPMAPKPLLEPLVAELPVKEDREIYSATHGFSNAIQTEDGVVQLFQHQQAKDETLYWATIETRLAISTPEANLREFNLKKDVGDILFLNYAKLMGLPAEPVPFEERLWEISAAEVRNTYLSKAVGNLVNAAARQSPDFPVNRISLFLKSQWVKKVEKLGAIKVKPGQTIAAFMQETVMLYGTMARYLRKMRQRYQPDNIFINCETTPEDLDRFIKTKWNFKRPAHTNDFTAFDQSQDGAMLQFEVIKAKFFNVPPEIIEGYIFIKLNAAIFLGTLGIMRLSGEGPTFDANTECSIAYNATRFHIQPDTAQVYAGDDMALDRISIEKATFHTLEKQLKLTSKPLFPTQTKGDYAEFCGWVLTPDGLIKQPLKMHASIMLQKKIQNISQSARSYALDLRYAYKMGDTLQEHLTEDEANYHQESVRQMHLLHQQDVLARGSASPPRETGQEGTSTRTQRRNQTKRRAKVRVATIEEAA
uniref:RNA replication protein n=1 Tax=Plantain virus X TaxID=1331744 RepID=A0A7H1JKS5_9VIRU|nr:RNA-dependent RNA polymerase [Plantain virus X]